MGLQLAFQIESRMGHCSKIHCKIRQLLYQKEIWEKPGPYVYSLALLVKKELRTKGL